MRSVLPIIASLALSFSVAGSAAATPAPAPAPTPAAPAANDSVQANDFNFAMYNALRSEKGNLFFSATSMREALGIAYLGARGETAKEMSSALRLDSDLAKSTAFAKGEIADFKTARGSASLTIANRLWTDKSFAMKPAFTSSALDAYGSPLDPVDFRSQSEPSRLQINAWVEKNTNDKIKDLLPRGSITSDTRLVITNAIWFKGKWAVEFEKKNTKDDAFLVDGVSSTKVPMMHQTNKLNVAVADGAKMLEMRYANSDLAMDIILPDSNTGLAAVEDKIVSGKFATWTGALRQNQVIVSLPKLTFTWGGSIKKPLSTLGMKTAFEESRADLTGIAPATGGNLYVSDVLHKAFVAVDEEGTEAAAATAVIIAIESTAVHEPPKPIVFNADHPFLIVIRDVNKGRVLFMGRVTNPKG